MNAILILGAGLMQKPALQAASRLGYKTAVADGNPHAVCVPIADIFRAVDLKDRDALLDYARDLEKTEGLAAVFTAGTDFSASASYLTEKMGLPGHSFEAAFNASDKFRMRSCFAKAGVPSPRFFSVIADGSGKYFFNDEDTVGSKKSYELHSLVEKAGLTSFPLVVKPVDNMGGRGCRMVRSEKELSEAVSVAAQFSRTKRAIIEEYMPGREFSIDALVFDGEVTITGFADRHIYYPPYFIEMGHTMPAVLDEKDWCVLAKTFRDGINALGLTHGVAKADIKLTPKGAMIGEIAARLSGGYMSGWTFPYASGMDLTEQALLLALGKKPEALITRRVRTPVDGIWNVETEKTSAERAWLSIPGKLLMTEGLPFSSHDEASDENPNKAYESAVLQDVLPRCGSGDDVSFPVNNVGKCGNIITCDQDYDKAVNAAEEAIASIVPVLAGDNDVTDAFLAEPLETEFPPSAFVLPDNVVTNILSECNGKKISSRDDIKLPEIVVAYAENLKDWNKRSIAKTLELFNEYKPSFNNMPLELFWRTLLRGGIQGILYMAEKYAGDK